MLITLTATLPPLPRQIVRLRKALEKIDTSLQKRPSAHVLKIEQRIGRWLRAPTCWERTMSRRIRPNSGIGISNSHRLRRLSGSARVTYYCARSFHKEECVDAHILVCFLALAMWRTLEQWMASKGLVTCARQFLLEMDNAHSMNVLLPTDTGTTIRVRTVSKPQKPLAMLLGKLGINLPQTPKHLENVAQKS